MRRDRESIAPSDGSAVVFCSTAGATAGAGGRGRLAFMAALALLAGCTSTPGTGAGPSGGSTSSGGTGTLTTGALSGALYGQSFALGGGFAVNTGGTLYVTLSSQALSCTNMSPTGSSYGLVNLIIPPQAQAAGTYPLGSAPAPHAIVAQYAGAPMSQQSKTLTAGTLRVDSADPTKLAGGLLVSAADATLNGTFTAVICPSP
jgi:hypothetical protein